MFCIFSVPSFAPRFTKIDATDKCEIEKVLAGTRDGNNMVVLLDFRKMMKNKKENNKGVQTL